MDATDNYLLRTNFLVTCNDLPVLTSLTQTIDFPNISINEVVQEQRFSDIKEPGEKLVYGELNLTYLIDEYMDSYFEILAWMEMMSGNNIQEYNRQSMVTDISVSVLTNKKNSTGRVFTFQDCFPTNLDPLGFDSTIDSVDPVLGSVTFAVGNMNVSNATLDITKFTKNKYKQSYT